MLKDVGDDPFLLYTRDFLLHFPILSLNVPLVEVALRAYYTSSPMLNRFPCCKNPVQFSFATVAAIIYY